MTAIQDLIKFGRCLYEERLNDSHSGNLSFRQGNAFWITRTGSRKGDLSFEDIVRAPLSDGADPKLSVDAVIHRAIYQAVPEAAAVIHAHPPHAVVLSLSREEIVPIDQEGLYYFRKVPVLTKCDWTIGAECVAKNLPEMLRVWPIVVVRGHGTYARGGDPEEAYKFTSVLESVCRLIYLKEVHDGNAR